MRRLPFRTAEDLATAAAAVSTVIGQGGVVLLPTETFYGLAAAPANEAGINRVRTIKDRPAGMALPVLCADWAQLLSLVRVPERYRVRLSRSWPGPLTVILPVVQAIAAGHHGSLAVRIPGHALLRALLYRVGPLTGTSANRHGVGSCTEADAALASLVASPDLVLDGGATSGGAPSTLVDLCGEPAKVLRVGPASWL